MQMRVVLLRHGKTPGNLEGRYVGRTDEGLTSQSAEEITRFVSACGETFYDGLGAVCAVYMSPMKRCVETAELLFQKYPRDGLSFHTVDGLRECDFGVFEYKNYAMLNGSRAYQRFLDTGGQSGFPGGEPLADFKRRCIRAFSQTVKRAFCDSRESGKTLVFIVHGGTIMAIMEAFACPHRKYYSWQAKNLSGYTARAEGFSFGASWDGHDDTGRIRLWDIAETVIL